MTEQRKKSDRIDVPENALGDLELPEAEGAEVKGGEDFQLWQSHFGAQPAQATFNGDGAVDSADYVVWRK